MVAKKFRKRSQGKRICFVTGHLKYAPYVCVPEAAHLRHLSKRLPAVLYRYWLILPREQVQIFCKLVDLKSFSSMSPLGQTFIDFINSQVVHP